MKPIKAKELIPEVATALELSEEVVDAIISYFYQDVRASLSNLKHPRIHVTHLGDFTIKHWKIDERIKRIENFEENNNLKGLSLINARFRVAETLYNLNNIKTMLEKESDKKKFIRLHKKTLHESKGKYHSDMEVKKPDSGGD